LNISVKQKQNTGQILLRLNYEFLYIEQHCIWHT